MAFRPRALRLIAKLAVASVLLLSGQMAPPARAQAKAFDELSARVAQLSASAKYAEALALAEDYAARARRELGEENATFARAIAWQAYLLQVLGRLTEAEPLFKKSLEIYERVLPAGHPDIATATNNLGFQYQITDRLEESERYYKRGLELRETALPPGSPAIADSLNNIAQVYKHQGRADEAIPLLKRSLDIRLKSLKPSDPLIAQSLANLGAAYERKGWFSDAEPLFRKALEVRQAAQTPNHPEIAGITSKLAQNLAGQKKFAEAEKLFEAALAMRYRSQPADHIDIATSLQDRARLLVELQRLGEAETLLQQALKIQREALPANHPTIAHALADLANVALLQERLDDALDRIREGITILVNRGKIDHLGKQRFSEFVKIAWRVFDRNKKKGIRNDTLLNEALRNAQRASDTQTGAAVTRMAARFAAKDVELHRVLRDRDDAERTQARLERELSSVLAMPIAKRGSKANAIRTELIAVANRLKGIDAGLRDQFPRYFGLIKPEPLDIAAVQKILAPDEALLSYFNGVDECYVWAVTRDRAEWHRLDADPRLLEKQIAELRTSLDVEAIASQGTGAKLFDLGLAHDLNRRLLGPLDPLIAGKPKLMVVANGALTSLPFQLLVGREPAVARPDLGQLALYRDADWLIRRHSVSVLPSVTSLQSIREVAGSPKSKSPFIGFGNPILGSRVAGGAPAPATPGGNARGLLKTAAAKPTRGYSSFWRGPAANLEAIDSALPPIPETETELRTVARNLNASESDLKLGAAATEAAVKTADLAQYRIVYFATHGLVAGELKGLGEPALVFSLPKAATDLDDGLLTASEVALLQLDADWVVLSACNTAAGEAAGAEALSGLARAFFHAGARALLVSHWKVGSEAAARLTTGTIEALKVDPGAGRADGLRRAMLALLDDAGDPWNPYPTFWAPFAVVGEGYR